MEKSRFVSLAGATICSSSRYLKLLVINSAWLVLRQLKRGKKTMRTSLSHSHRNITAYLSLILRELLDSQQTKAHKVISRGNQKLENRRMSRLTGYPTHNQTYLNNCSCWWLHMTRRLRGSERSGMSASNGRESASSYNFDDEESRIIHENSILNDFARSGLRARSHANEDSEVGQILNLLTLYMSSSKYRTLTKRV